MRTFNRCTVCDELFAEELEVIEVRVAATEPDPIWGSPEYKKEFWAVCEDCKGSLGIKEPE